MNSIPASYAGSDFDKEVVAVQEPAEKTKAEPKPRNTRSRRLIIGLSLGFTTLVLALGLGLGLDLGLPQGSSNEDDSTLDDSPIRGPLIDANFADPCYLDYQGTYRAYASNRFHRDTEDQINIQMARSTDFVNWNLTDIDMLPDPGRWASGEYIWSPDVVQLDNEVFVLYYAAQHLESQRQCIHAAFSGTPEGPFRPLAGEPLICPIEQGGAVDPEGFVDVNGDRYILYKVDGNSINHSESVWNPTPIMLQRVEQDGVTLVGEPVVLLDHSDEDGPLIEAPTIGYYEVTEHQGLYFLFFSSNIFSAELYDITYATSSSVNGPYRRSDVPLLRTGDGSANLTGPGSLDLGTNNRTAIFHSIKHESPTGDIVRTMWSVELSIEGNNVILI